MLFPKGEDRSRGNRKKPPRADASKKIPPPDGAGIFFCVGNVQQPTASNQQPTPNGRGAADAAPDSFHSPRHRAAASLRAGYPRPWDVENPLHWVLDMIFDEDHSRARSGFSAENLAIMRHMAYNATRKSAATKGGMKRRKKSLTWNQEKLLATLRAA